MTRILLISAMIVWGAMAAAAQTTAFTYQGSLSSGGGAANGPHDFEFVLFDGGGAQIGSTITRSGITVTNGAFTVSLDFGNVFPGAARFLEIHVRQMGGGSYTVLAPRQAISNTPYAVKSLTADTATNAAQLGGLAANQYVVTTDARLSDARTPTAGSPNYLQNGTTQQGGNFNISGNGTAGGTLSGNVVNAATQYNIGGNRVFSIPGQGNVFAGRTAGMSNTTGVYNSFFGDGAGSSNTLGESNSFFGAFAGQGQSTGSFNAFFGTGAGLNNAGNNNSFYGSDAGVGNVTGSENSYFGAEVGRVNGLGRRNSLFGFSSGFNNTGDFNVFMGWNSGQNNTTGERNVFLGAQAGLDNGIGNLNTFVGYSAAVTHSGGSGNTAIGFSTFVSPNLTNATAIGAFAAVDQSNSLVLGSVAGIGGAPATVNVGIGTTSPLAMLHVNGPALYTTGNNREVSIGNPNGESGIGIKGTSNRADMRFDASALRLVAGVGTGPPPANSGVSITTAGNVGIGQTSPLAKLDVAGTLKVDSLAGGGDVNLCRNSTFNTIATCGSSLRYKTGVLPLSAGLDVIRNLRPITFTWKDGGARDLGLGAEEVAKIEPLLVTHNDKGEIEGVKYAQLSAILINAVKEQQAQIEAQAAQIARQNAINRKQETEINALKTFVCRSHRRSAMCRAKN